MGKVRNTAPKPLPRMGKLRDTNKRQVLLRPTKQKITKPSKIGNKLRHIQTKIDEIRTACKNRHILQVKNEIRENIKKNRSRLVWKRLNRLKNNETKQKDTPII